jgi:hypothetical protein
VGRGSQYFLRNRRDVFRTFLFASRDYKIHRLVCGGTPERDAIEQVDTTDRDRAAFVKKYLKLNWPAHHLYNAMFSTEMGDSYVSEMLVEYILLDGHELVFQASRIMVRRRGDLGGKR